MHSVVLILNLTLDNFMQMTSMLKQNADNADSVDNCAKSPSYPISELCAPASRSPAGWAPSYVLKYKV